MRKIILNLIMICMLISLVGVGYATWDIIKPTEDFSNQGNITLEELSKLDVITNNTFDDAQLKYNKNGFYEKSVYDESDEDLIKYIKYSIVNYQVTINLDECRDKLKDVKFIEICFTLKDETGYVNALRDLYEKVEATITGMDDLTEPSYHASDEKLNIYVMIPLDNKLSTTTITLTLDFKNVEAKDYFSVLSNFEKDKAFTISASLHGTYE